MIINPICGSFSNTEKGYLQIKPSNTIFRFPLKIEGYKIKYLLELICIFLEQQNFENESSFDAAILQNKCTTTKKFRDI